MNWDEIFSRTFPDKNAAPEENAGREKNAAAALALAQEERYEDVDDYDPVLRSHCNL